MCRCLATGVDVLWLLRRPPLQTWYMWLVMRRRLDPGNSLDNRSGETAHNSKQLLRSSHTTWNEQIMQLVHSTKWNEKSF